MNTETQLLISDAQHVLRGAIESEGTRNPLASAFLGWLLQDDDSLASLKYSADSAAASKGAERNSRNVAMLGFACGVKSLSNRFANAFVQQLTWLMGRPSFANGGEPSGVVADPINIFGVIVGAESVLPHELDKRFKQWAATTWKDADRLVQDGCWRRELLNFIGGRINNTKAPDMHNGGSGWLAAALNRSGWGNPLENSISHVLKAAIKDNSCVNDGFEAGLRLAAIDWAVARAMDFDLAAMTVADISMILHRLPTVFQRWPWEKKSRTGKRGGKPRQWHIENEYHFQSLLFTILKPLIPKLEEEQYLSPTGPYQPRADLCIKDLELVIEVKFWYRGKNTKTIIEGIGADLSLYLRADSPYRKVIAAIWDDGARIEEHEELRRGLMGLNGLSEVVIISRPSCME